MADIEKPPAALEKRSGSHDLNDAEKQSIPGETETLKRNLKNRHIQMIAIGQPYLKSRHVIKSLQSFRRHHRHRSLHW
jgi:hypothetical protein